MDQAHPQSLHQRDDWQTLWPSRSRLSELPEYGRFIEGAYGCGFVTTDFATGDKLASGASYQYLKNRPQEVQYLPLQTVKHMVHIPVRAERSNFEMIVSRGVV